MASMIYLDNSATSWPKPRPVIDAMVRFLETVGANPGRSGHRLSIEAAGIVYTAREAVAELFGAADPLKVVLTPNATEALNLALRGLLKPGDVVVTGGMEHNSVMRPLSDLQKIGVKVTVVPASGEGELDPDDFRRVLRSCRPAMVTLNHGSNVTGNIAPIREVGALAKEAGAYFLVDAAQTGGFHPIDMQNDNIDMLAFTGHKSLYGPQGTGGLILGESVDDETLTPLKSGGTGSRSEYENQPDFSPDRFESGTMNAVGLAGLLAGVRFVLDRDEKIREHELRVTNHLMTGLSEIPGIRIYGPPPGEYRIPVISLTLDTLSPSEAGFALDEDFGILTRVGLHCSPSAHRSIGTFPTGTIRLSPGFFVSIEDAGRVVGAFEALQGGSSQLKRPHS